MSSGHGAYGAERPEVDARLIAPETRYEVEDGKVVYVAPADEPHGSRHSKVSALVEAHAADGYDVASDMLTRTSELDDFAPDVSVFPAARDPESGNRQLEELAFEVVSTERLSHAGRKAAKLAARGVRRVFAIDVERQRAFEWSRELGSWAMLAERDSIADRALAVALPIEALVRAAKADDAVARALLAKGNPVLTQALEARAVESRLEGKVEGKAEGKAEALLAVLTARGFALSEAQRARIRDPAHAGELDRWLKTAVSCTTVEQLFVRDR